MSRKSSKDLNEPVVVEYKKLETCVDVAVSSENVTADMYKDISKNKRQSEQLSLETHIAQKSLVGYMDVMEKATVQTDAGKTELQRELE